MIDMTKVYGAQRKGTASPESVQHVLRVIKHEVESEKLQKDMESDFIELAAAGHSIAFLDISYNNDMSLFSLWWSRFDDACEHGITRITRQNQQAYLESQDKIRNIVEDMLDSNKINYRIDNEEVYADSWRTRYVIKLTK